MWSRTWLGFPLLVCPQAPHSPLHNPTSMEEPPEASLIFHLTWCSVITAHDSIFAVAVEKGAGGALGLADSDGHPHSVPGPLRRGER